jgi:hypothetical protein
MITFYEHTDLVHTDLAWEVINSPSAEAWVLVLPDGEVLSGGDGRRAFLRENAECTKHADRERHRCSGKARVVDGKTR